MPNSNGWKDIERAAREQAQADRLWSVREAARYLSVSRWTMYRLPIRFSMVGQRRRYDPADVRLYVALHQSRRASA